VLALAADIAALALDQMGDAVGLSDWYDLDGNEADPRKLLLTPNADELVNAIEQISDHMKGDKSGYIDLWKYSDVFALIEEQSVEDWSSKRLKNTILECRTNTANLLRLIYNRLNSFLYALIQDKRGFLSETFSIGEHALYAIAA
jgi:hypothetical protein